MLLAVIGVFCAMALIDATTMATAERVREFALLRLTVATKRQVKTMIRAETLITVTFGLTIGSLIAAPGLVAFNYSLTGAAFPSVPIRNYSRCWRSTPCWVSQPPPSRPGSHCA